MMGEAKGVFQGTARSLPGKSILKNQVFRLFRPLVRALNAGGKYYCPVCESSLRLFLPYGAQRRRKARCPLCLSLERHRLDWLFLRERTDLLDGLPKTMLHVAPEECLSRRLQKVPGLTYQSIDLQNPRAMVRMDITCLAYPDNRFSLIYCSHVLEHVPDDRKAIAELYRVLAPGGWALIQVPVGSRPTYENPAMTSPEERKEHFGQWDHVRRCGPDYIERIGAGGFTVREFRGSDLATNADCARMGFPPGRRIYYCEKFPSPERSG